MTNDNEEADNDRASEITLKTSKNKQNSSMQTNQITK
jgi:hypothetical protein